MSRKPTGSPPGRPGDERRRAWGLRFGLTKRQRENLTPSLMEQLELCKSDAARRLIMGVSEQRSSGIRTVAERSTT
jgi:hypothetical protein